MNWASYVTQIATMAVVDPANTAFLTVLGEASVYANNRICQDLDLLSTVTTTTASLGQASRTITLPSDGTFVTLQEINAITPVGTTDPAIGTRNPLVPTTKEVLDFTWPSSTGSGVPSLFAMLNQSTIIVGPWADQTYTMELVGTVRPAPLSVTTTTTFISLYLEDLLVLASMIYIAGYQRNYSSTAANDPQMAVNYETQYQARKTAALVEESRKRFASVGWTSMSPSPVATPNIQAA